MKKPRTLSTLTGLCALVLLLLALAACGTGPASDGEAAGTEPLAARDLAVLHEEEFGGVYLDLTIEDFNALGFAYGDSVDLAFSNGYELKDVPYYNGYYTRNGDPLLVAYPGYPHIKAVVNDGDDLFVLAGLAQGDTAAVTLAEAGKYLEIQQARDIHYRDDREEFPSDEAFANFRAVTAGEIRPGTLYRSASPCDNQHNRAPYVDALLGEAGVQTILDLADSDGKLAGYLRDEDFASPHFLALYEAGGVIPAALNMNFESRDFREKLASGLTALTEAPGPWLVHCTEGKDRTGFVCMVLEALCGADYGEIVDDYMRTYDNYYQITPASDPDRYDVIVAEVLEPMVETLAGEGADLRTADLAGAAEAYLLDAGMAPDRVAALRAALTGGLRARGSEGMGRPAQAAGRGGDILTLLNRQTDP